MPEIQNILSSLDDCHYAALFISPRSEKWPALKEILEASVYTYEQEDLFFALFRPTSDDLEILYQTLLLTQGWKTAHFCARDRELTRRQIWYPVACNHNKREFGKFDSCTCESVNLYDMDSGKPVRVFTVPCRQIRDQWYRTEKAESYLEQFVSCARAWGVDTCPFFQIETFSGPIYRDRRGNPLPEKQPIAPPFREEAAPEKPSRPAPAPPVSPFQEGRPPRHLRKANREDTLSQFHDRILQNLKQTLATLEANKKRPVDKPEKRSWAGTTPVPERAPAKKIRSKIFKVLLKTGSIISWIIGLFSALLGVSLIAEGKGKNLGMVILFAIGAAFCFAGHALDRLFKKQ